MERPTWAPAQIDPAVPSAARMYDYFLGGSHNFAVDRERAEQALRVMPELAQGARDNRAFLRRAVTFCVEQGIDQFLDLGSGVPTSGNVHEVAQALNPQARVVYVDTDPVVIAHSRALTEGDPRVEVLQADAREPETVLGSAAVRRRLRLDEPVAVLMVSLLHFIADEDDPAGLVMYYHDAVTPGSLLVLSHLTPDGHEEQIAQAQQVLRRSTTPGYPRTHAEVEPLFGSFSLVDPGVVPTPRWRPDVPTDEVPHDFSGYAGVGRKLG